MPSRNIAEEKMKRGAFLVAFPSCVCNDIPLESKEVPIREKGKRMASCHTWTCKKMKNANNIVLYFIFDVATKRIPLKGCFYVPDVLLPTTCIGTTTGHHATNHFFREKSRKKLGQIAFLLGQYAQKGGRLAIPKRGSNHSFPFFPFYLLSIWRIHPDKSAKICHNIIAAASSNFT